MKGMSHSYSPLSRVKMLESIAKNKRKVEKELYRLIRKYWITVNSHSIPHKLRTYIIIQHQKTILRGIIINLTI